MLVRALALALASALVACRDRAAPADVDSTLARDLALARTAASPLPMPADTALSDAPAPRPVEVARETPRRAPRATPLPTPRRPQAPQPVAATPRPAPRREPVREERPAPVERVAEAPAAGSTPTRTPGLGAGTVIALTSNQRVCANTNLPGDKITATSAGMVVGDGGARIPDGARVVLELAQVVRGDPIERSQMIFRVRSIYFDGTAHPASGAAEATTPLEQVRVAGGTSDKRKVVGGAIAGAVLGQVLGKSTKATVIGAAAGAAAGTAAAKAGERFEGCLPTGANIRLVLDERMVVAGD